MPLLLTAGHDDGISAAELLKAQNDVRSTLVTLLAATAAAIGLTFTGRTYFLNASGQVTDRYSKAVGQLGEKDVAVRVGAVYALERVGRDSPRDAGTIVEVLSTFVRAACPLPADPAEVSALRPDVQAAVNVLGRAPLSRSSVPVDLRGAYLDGVDLTNAMFDGALLRAAHLTNGRLRGVSLQGAWLSAARLDGADLEAAGLGNARLREAVLDAAILKGADLRGADLDAASVTGTWLAGAKLRHGQLTPAQLAEANGTRNIHWQD
ncbi:pentapeptide repeat-containing protein [Actinoplanes sp. L3-i22]|uniref:pentapeptide repeat-containing protein n=1 Tax=Actinoplanes sp. L3-i22 TaxID=2836373 RepID=UPI001C75BF00|nr:pentapeptide repeat-containing protein [Actinoplanes sp. L3-i22]BCY09718.1 hypothetical protein L3i22_048060 [Actinoplanes sp. L3-i22]